MMNWQPLLKYPCVLLAGFLVTYLFTPLVRRCASRIGMVDRPGQRRIHARTTPRAGGLAVFVGFHTACLVTWLIPWAPFAGRLTLDWWWFFLVGSSALLVLGLADDAFGLKPWTKLTGQTAVAVYAFVVGMRVGDLLNVAIPWWLDLTATVLWFLTIINAFNLIDGLDGLATGLGCIAAAGLGGALMLRQLPGDVMIMLGLLGSCLAFLRYNFYPASIFLGDTGSMFIGFTVAAVALITGAKSAVLASIGVPILAVGVPVFDTFLAIWRRGARGLLAHSTPTDDVQAGRIFSPDTDHLHHRLIRSGLSQPAVASRLYLLGLALVAAGLLAMVFQSYAGGIYLAVLITSIYVIVKHLARLELWDSGEIIVRGLRRPPGRAMAVILYPPLDLALLALTFGISLAMTHPEMPGAHIKRLWVHEVPLWLGLPFLLMFLGQSYSRVWSRARISEYFFLAAMLAGGVALAGFIAVIQTPSNRAHLVLRGVLYAGLAVPAIAGVRAFPRAVQDSMSAARRNRPGDRVATWRLAVYGAGLRSTLFLRELSFGIAQRARPVEIVGLFDDDPNLHGRLVHGFRVFGGIATITPDFLVRTPIDEIVVAADILSDHRDRLLQRAESCGIRVCEWRTVLTPLNHPESALSTHHVRTDGDKPIPTEG